MDSTIADELNLLRNTKSEIATAITEMGVEVGNVPFRQYPDLIRNIPTTPTLSGLKQALNNGTAQDKYPVGTEISDTWNGNDNPLIVAQYLNETNNSAYGGAVGVILIRKYVEPTSQVFGSNTNYRSSAIKSFLDTTYLSNCSKELRAIISDISIPVYNSALEMVSSKFFLMSAYEVCNRGRDIHEGDMWDYWKQKTGLNAPDAMYTSNSGRVMKNRNGDAWIEWLRSGNGNNAVYCVGNSGSVDSMYNLNNNLGVAPACFISKH